MREDALFHINACTSPQRHCGSFHNACIHTGACSYGMCVCMCLHVQYVCECECASMYLGNSLIPGVAGIGEGLQLDSWLRDSLSSLGLNDSPINVLLQVDKATVVAHSLTTRDVVFFYKIGVPNSVSSHDVVHVHADSVADFGR